MADLNGDGITDPGEEYPAFRIRERMTGIKEEDETETLDEEGNAT